MEESKDLQSIYKIFRTFIYLSLVIEFFEYAITPGMLTFWGGIVADIHGRMKLMDIYQDGHLLHSKIMTLLIICVTCIGTRNKKHLEFNAKRMVIYPLSFGLMLMFLSVWMFYRGWQPCFFSQHVALLPHVGRGHGALPCGVGQHLEVSEGRTAQRPLQPGEREFPAERQED
jgi:hypothetical protein